MAMDTGADISIVPEGSRRQCSQPKGLQNEPRSQTYTSEPIPIISNLLTLFVCNIETIQFVKLVYSVEGNCKGSSLLGWNWLKYLQLNWIRITLDTLHIVEDNEFQTQATMRRIANHWTTQSHSPCKIGSHSKTRQTLTLANRGSNGRDLLSLVVSFLPSTKVVLALTHLVAN